MKSADTDRTGRLPVKFRALGAGITVPKARSRSKPGYHFPDDL